MGDINRAREELKASNFTKALESFKALLENRDLSLGEILECCHSIESLFGFLGKAISFEYTILLSNKWIECGEYEKAAQSFQRAYEQTKDLNFLKQVHHCYKETGQLEKAREIAESYLKEALKYGFTPRAEEFIENNGELFTAKENDQWKLHILLAAGDVEGIEAFITSHEGESWSPELLEKLFQEIAFHTRYWHSSPILLAFLLEMLVDKDELLVKKKHAIKILIDAWLTLEKDFDLINKTLLIARKRGLNILGHELSKIVGKYEEMEYFAGKESKETLNLSSLDFGLDLLLGEEEDNQLERNIKFLIRSGLRAEAMKLISQLKKENPESPLVALLKEDQREEKRASVNINSLIKEIGRYSSDFHSQENLESGYQNLDKFYEQDYIEANYEDMVIGLKLLNLPQVALGILERLDEKRRELSERININYLKVEILISLGNYHQARDLTVDVLGKEPLNDNEKIAFLYLRAEAYYGAGDFENALIDYKYILQEKKSYRLAKERIKELEKNE